MADHGFTIKEHADTFIIFSSLQRQEQMSENEVIETRQMKC